MVEHEVVYCISEALLNNMNVACSQCGKRDGLPHNSLQSDSYAAAPVTMLITSSQESQLPIFVL